MNFVFQQIRINILQISSILLSSILFIIPLIYSTDWKESYPKWAQWTVFWVFVIYILIQLISIYDNWDKQKIKEEIENWRKEAWILLESHIMAFSRKLNFWNDHDSIINRISIYMMNEKWFYCVERNSDNEEYKKKSPKLYMSVDKWILSAIWNTWNREWKWFYDGSILNTRKWYPKHHKEKYKLTQSDIDALHMRSLLYYGWRIDHKNKPLAVILYESTKQDKFTQVKLDQIFHDEVPPIVHALRFILPNLPIPLYDNNKTI